MTDKEFFVETIRDEAPRFERVFKSLPQDKLHHTHHAKSKTAGELLVQMTHESESFLEFLTSGVTDWTEVSESAKDVEILTSKFVKGFEEAASKAESMSEEEWGSEAVATHNGKEIWRTTRGKMAWGLLLDLIHHRGQLSTYIRPMGGKVPSIYGPSGDTME